MPQLDPAPWFMIFVSSWAIFLTIIPAKILAHTSPNEPTHQSSEKAKTESWSWPWY
uniref:ATP synthase complex subunit 8 n=1 Tax=Chrysiptera galba TaxID=229101 RepID=Q7Y6M4_9TELE|nr:ATP synthase 8 [Chrysiptera galba]AAP75323.1 ATP synthase 8 [Chrysiptera galba]QUJ18393.1 ATP synthase protein 8 [Chrysiptera galba]